MGRRDYGRLLNEVRNAPPSSNNNFSTKILVKCGVSTLEISIGEEGSKLKYNVLG